MSATSPHDRKSMWASYGDDDAAAPYADSHAVPFTGAPPVAWTSSNGQPLQDYYGTYSSGVGYSNAGDERPYSMQEEERTARGAAWSKCSLGSAPARLLRLLRARLAALGGSVLPGRGRPSGRLATALGVRASRLQSRPFPRL